LMWLSSHKTVFERQRERETERDRMKNSFYICWPHHIFILSFIRPISVIHFWMSKISNKINPVTSTYLFGNVSDYLKTPWKII
jgi:hypothetical protein